LSFGFGYETNIAGMPITSYPLSALSIAIKRIDSIYDSNNVKEFVRIPGLLLENWAKG